MPKKIKLRPTAWGLAIAAWDVYRRLPPSQRARLHAAALKHGPKVAKKVATTATKRTRKTAVTAGKTKK